MATVKDGPLQVPFHRDMAGGGIVHQLGHDEGMHPVLALFIDGAVILVPGVHAAARRAQNDAGLRGQFALERQARLANRLFRRQQGELREPVVKRDLLAVEMRLGVIVADLPADLDRQPVDIADIQRADAAAALAHRLERRRSAVRQGR